MIGRVSKLLHYLILVIHFRGGNGFQSSRSARHGSVAFSAKLFVTTTSNSVSTDNDSTDKSIPLKIDVDFKAYGNGYKTVFSEIPYADCKASFGSIPSDLKGSYFRAGPGEIWNHRRRPRHAYLFSSHVSIALCYVSFLQRPIEISYV